MSKFEHYFYLACVAALPVFVTWILSFGIEGGFWVALRFIGPALAVIYPPIAVYMTAQAFKKSQS